MVVLYIRILKLIPLQVEVGPSSFIKIKMLGKGDVGRVYLVREKKTDKLYAMKGKLYPNSTFLPLCPAFVLVFPFTLLFIFLSRLLWRHQGL